MTRFARIKNILLSSIILGSGSCGNGSIRPCTQGISYHGYIVNKISDTDGLKNIVIKTGAYFDTLPNIEMCHVSEQHQVDTHRSLLWDVSLIGDTLIKNKGEEKVTLKRKDKLISLEYYEVD